MATEGIVANIASTAAAASALCTIGEFGFSVNISVASGTPTGVLSVKYLNLQGDVAASVPAWCTLPINSGLFLNGVSTFTLNSGSAQSAAILGFYWLPSGTPAGSISILGQTKS